MDAQREENIIRSNPQEFTVIELKKILRSRECNTTGNKTELIQRLYEHDPEGSWMQEFQQRPGVDATVQNGGQSDLELVVRENETLLQELAAAKRQIEELKCAKVRQAQEAQSQRSLREAAAQREAVKRQLEQARQEFDAIQAGGSRQQGS